MAKWLEPPGGSMRIVMLLLFAIPALAGCLSSETVDEESPIVLPPLPVGVSISGNASADLYEELITAEGTYYSIGASTFEPTIDTTSTGGIFMNSFAGLGRGTQIRRSMDQGQTWEDVTPNLPTGAKAVPNSNDPFIYVDPWTDRIYDFDMCLILSGFCVSYSDDDGATWLTQSIATGEAPALDHQSLAAAPAGESQTVGYPNVLVFCVNRGLTTGGSWCSSSFDGGIVWTPAVPGFPTDKPQCHGLSGHVVGANDGTFYRGNPSCDGPAVYRSEDGGLTWTQHDIASEVGVLSHEIAAAVDEDGGVHAFWIGSDGLPRLASSADKGETWSEARIVGADGVTAAGFPTAVAGASGRVAFAYIGSTDKGGYDGDPDTMKWNGYIGITIDAFADAPTFVQVAVNKVDDPLDEGGPCGRVRCGGFGDFIDIAVDAEGRPWAAMAHNGYNNAGIVGTLRSGPSLIEGQLTVLPVGGAAVWE